MSKIPSKSREEFNSDLTLLITLSIWLSPSKAKNSHCNGIKTLSEAARAFVVRKPNPGGQSTIIADYCLGNRSIAFFKINSFSESLGTSYSALAKETLDGTTPKPFTSVDLIASTISTFSVKTS